MVKYLMTTPSNTTAVDFRKSTCYLIIAKLRNYVISIFLWLIFYREIVFTAVVLRRLQKCLYLL
ncbi:hypothetical protein XBO1_2150003 [Xenorhabdus bovienii str. oregonense]|uniref:Uncharacterized protein n=1 Tax=Xenorhabdus bovienii str. oregonense TaxID=1398202 RepID=A0A077P520_XENBV|nr:hypothetical protein XBO1_2150003 [Xenorhabdus bovienii str. oregonense]